MIPAPLLTEYRIPHAWQPRPYQRRAMAYFDQPGEGKRAIWVWHRRAGKDDSAMNVIAKEAHKRIGTYWHIFPEHVQARRAIWNGIDRAGRNYIDRVFPAWARDKRIEQEMRVDFKCGSRYYLLGSDNYNSLVGANPVGVVFSEFALCQPAAWDYVRPMLLENGGWALFISTPRGKNHLHTLYQMAVKDPRWSVHYLTVRDTFRRKGEMLREGVYVEDDTTPVISEADIELERSELLRQGKDDAIIDQEYYLSWTGSVEGAIYRKQLGDMRKEGRIGKFPYVQGYPVHTFWDLGHSDSTAIWAMQRLGQEMRFIWSYQASFQPLSHFAEQLQGKPWVFGRFHLPHDAGHVRLGQGSFYSNETIADMLQKNVPFARDVVLVPRCNALQEGIEQTRAKMPFVTIDEEACAEGLSALESYRKVWDERQQCFREEPAHDWTSHYADAFRQFGQTGVIPQDNSASGYDGYRRKNRRAMTA